MKFPKPSFELSRVLGDGTSEVLEIVPITSLPPDTKMGRRQFLGAGISISAVLATMTACAAKKVQAPVPGAETYVIRYSQYDQATGRTVTYTLPCGTPIPPGAVCVCNCVPVAASTGSDCTCESVCRCVGNCTCNQVCGCVPQQICTCNQVCTCERVCTCVPQTQEL